MLEELNKVKWSSITHSHGTAEQVPMWIQNLTSDIAEKRELAIFNIESYLFHQGMLTLATYHALPFLFEIATSQPQQERLIDLLFEILRRALYINSSEYRSLFNLPSTQLNESNNELALSKHILGWYGQNRIAAHNLFSDNKYKDIETLMNFLINDIDFL